MSQICVSCANEDMNVARRLAAAVAAVPGSVACSAALDRDDPIIYAAFASLIGPTVVPMFMGGKPA